MKLIVASVVRVHLRGETASVHLRSHGTSRRDVSRNAVTTASRDEIKIRDRIPLSPGKIRRVRRMEYSTRIIFIRETEPGCPTFGKTMAEIKDCIEDGDGAP